jgi:hypothetical protein
MTMELTHALLEALWTNAGVGIKNISLAKEDSILLTHISGEQLLINVHALAPHIMGDPERLLKEAQGALAALDRAASRKQRGNEEDVQAHLVPVIRHLDWLMKAGAQTGRDMLADGLAIQLSKTLFVSFALEYADRREPVLDWPSMDVTQRNALLDLALANQKRMMEAEPEALLATDLHMDDGTFFLQSKNLQAASLMLQPWIWGMSARYAAKPPEVTLAAIVSADVVAFGPADVGSQDIYAGMLTSAVRGLRKSFGGDGEWGSEVFVFPKSARLPDWWLPEFGPEHS